MEETVSRVNVIPYINFQGRAREALEFYQQALGGTVLFKTTDDQGTREAAPGDVISHASLKTDGVTIMGTDGVQGYPLQMGENVAIALSGKDYAQLSSAFGKLAEGGTIKQALQVETWGDTFGFLVDKFGVNWMINISQASL